MSRTAIKSQILADFLAEWTPSGNEAARGTMEPEWTVHVDGSWCSEGAGIGIVLSSLEGNHTLYRDLLEFKTTDNGAEYEAYLFGLRQAPAVRIKRLVLKSDSQLIVVQIDKSYQAKDPEMIKYLAMARAMEKFFLRISVRSIPRGDNTQADMLARVASGRGAVPPGVLYEVLGKSAVKGIPDVQLSEEQDWRTLLLAYLRDETELEDPTEAQRLQARARGFIIHEDVIYKRGVCAPFPHCVSQADGLELHADIHRAPPTSKC